MSSKRDVNSDQPRRIYLSTLNRIDKHLQSRPREFKKSKRQVKGDFNKFLETLINVYEDLQAAPAIYILNGVIYDNAMDARGEAIKISVKTKKPVKWPDVYVYIGPDEA